jgi:tetratricopeptide (TPR) repeat protein
LADEGRYAEAIALLEESAKRRPDAALLADLGYAYYLDGQSAPALTALERACLLEPSNALAWERLAALLQSMGESGRALGAMRQARTLRETAAQPTAPAPGARPAATAASGLWPAGMARVEVRQVGAGMVEVVRVERHMPAPAVDRKPAPARARPAVAMRIEVSNGNGIPGMAAAVARSLRAEGMQVVRLTNTIPFNVEQTRIEIRGSGEPQMRIVLGKDLEIKKPPAGGRRQAP